MKPLAHAILVALGLICLGLLSGCGGSTSSPQPLKIATTSLPNGTVGTPYMQTIQATGGVAPFTWTVSVGALPHNLNLNSSATDQETISGTPNTQQTAVAFSITVTDSANQSASQSYSVTIGGSASGGSPISVSILPSSASLQESGTQQFAATVTNDPTNGGVTWSLEVVQTSAMGSLTCNNGVDCGQISPSSTSSGASTMYTAPSSVFTPPTEQVLVTATSVADNTKSATVTVTISSGPISVIIFPTAALIQVTGTVHFGAGLVNSPPNGSVSWNISGCAGGATVCGTFANINNSSLTADYVAPATVPPGGKVSVTVTSTVDNTKSSTAVVTISPINFTSQNYSAGSSPNAVAVADFNGDGKLDLAVADYGNPSSGDNGGISILLGNGDGTFQPAISATGGKNPLFIAAGDFNNDGKQDLVLTDFGDRSSGGNGNLTVLLGNGAGTFQSPITLTAGPEPFDLALGDFNNDGNLDFTVTDFSAGVYLFLGNGDGTFQSPVLFTTGNSPVAIAAQDFNGDGTLDLAIAGFPPGGLSTTANSTVAILLGNGGGTFAPAVSYPINTLGPTSMAAGDLNGDSKSDLAITSFICGFGLCTSETVTLLGNGDGTFQPEQDLWLARCECGELTPLSIHIADLSSNGRADLVQIGFSNVAVLPGNGDGTFQGPLYFGADAAPFALAIGDFNGDGKPDIVVANKDSNDVTVLLNATSP